MFSRTRVFTLVGILVLIVVVTASVVGGAPRKPSLGAVAPFLVVALLTWYLITLVVYRSEIIAGIAAIVGLRRKQDFAETSLWVTVIAYALFLGAIIIILWTGVPQRIASQIQELVLVATRTATVPNSTQTNPLPEIIPSAVLTNYAIFVLVAVFAFSFVLLIAGLYLAIKTRETTVVNVPSSTEMRTEASQVVMQTIAGLKMAKEYHETILQCYRKMCQVLSNAGIEVMPTETPREFAKNISMKLEVGDEAVKGLTFLFEEARYSNHIISEDMRARAVNDLKSLQQALSASVGVTP